MTDAVAFFLEKHYPTWLKWKPDANDSKRSLMHVQQGSRCVHTLLKRFQSWLPSWDHLV